MENIRLNVSLLRKRVPNLTREARAVGLRPATVSNLCTGKIPIERAEIKTLVALSVLADCSLDELIIRDENGELIEIGIKTIDLFAPLITGGTVGLVARPGMGQLVVLGEVLHRLKKNKNCMVLLLKPQGDYPEISDITNNVDIIAASIEEAYKVTIDLGADTKIVLAADRSHVITREIYKLQERLKKVGINYVSTFLVDLKGEAVDVDLPYGPLETLWQFDANLAARGKYPAINPLYSTSTILEGEFTNHDHFVIQQKAKKLIRRYRELRSLVNVNGKDKLPGLEKQTYIIGERLEAYLTQPLYVAEEVSGKKGVNVNLLDTLTDVRKILDKKYDERNISELEYIGRY
ncbi:hypothetical protein [Fictibacillus nanhaiensis]|uniref:ATP synthase beta subunit C-terminal domain-containing protein n=1 Tax=Fictibacillus nanhaiensis TaxID=742169 RepID=UPI003C29EFD5